MSLNGIGFMLIKTELSGKQKIIKVSNMTFYLNILGVN